jgi:hypothetical protein
MKPLEKLLRTTLYLLPRLMLFSVVILCFLITLVVSVDSLADFRPPLDQFRATVVRLLGM